MLDVNQWWKIGEGMSHGNAQCDCGTVKYEITGQPLVRGFCHCTICQAVNDASYADIMLYRGKDVKLPDNTLLAFNAEKFPPILQRGKCKACHKLSIEYFNVFPGVQLIVVPTGVIQDTAVIPDPSLHIFYHSRVADIDDPLPKYSGYLKSQMAFGKQLLSALVANK